MRALRTFGFAVALLLLVLYGISYVSFVDNQGPYVTWAAMQRMWNKIAGRNVQITQVQPAPDGYLISFAPALIMNVSMRGEQIRSLRLQYDSNNDPGGSGQFFLQGVTAAVRMGSYSWPQEERTQVEAAFAGISPLKTTFSYGPTTFTRQAFPGGVWEFFMEYQLAP